MRTGTVVEILASLVNARATCIRTNNTEWRDRHEANAEQIVSDMLPSGSGWDNGTTLDWDRSTDDHLVFAGAYHHMDEGGGYDGWTDHTVSARPSFIGGFSLTVSGRNRGDIKEYLTDTFHYALAQTIQWDDAAQRYTGARSPIVCAKVDAT